MKLRMNSVQNPVWKGRMEHHQTGHCVVIFPSRLDMIYDRQHQNLERHEVARYKDEEQRQRPAEICRSPARSP